MLPLSVRGVTSCLCEGCMPNGSWAKSAGEHCAAHLPTR
jgi:hypothetical protein